MTTVAVVNRAMGALTFDAVFEESHTSEMEVTENPVDNGSSITDHTFMKQDRLRITAGVSNTPLRTTSDSYGIGEVRAVNAHKALLDLQRTREPFIVVTGLKTYYNMVCTSISVIQDKDTCNALFFVAELRAIEIVSTQTVTYPPRKPGKPAAQASKTKDKGEQQGKTDTESKEAPKKASALKRLSTALGLSK